MASFQRSSTTDIMRTNEPSKRPSLLVDYSKLSSRNLKRSTSTANTSLRSVAYHHHNNKRASTGTSKVPASPSQPMALKRRHSERSNRARILKVLDQATAELSSSKTATPSAVTSPDVTFCIKRRSLESTTDNMGSKSSFSDSDIHAIMDDTMDSSGSNSNSSDDNARPSLPRSDSGLPRRSYHALLEPSTSMHSVFGSSNHMRRQKSFRRTRSLNLKTNDKETEAPKRTSSLKSSSDSSKVDLSSKTTDIASFHDGQRDLSLMTARKSKSSRNVMSGDAAAPGRIDRRAMMSRQKSQPLLLLPRQRSLKDLKAGKTKAQNRSTLSKQGSFTTKQSEFAALEALIGKKRPANNNKQTIRRAKSLDTSGFAPSSSPPISPVGERRAVALTTPTKLLTKQSSSKNTSLMSNTTTHVAPINRRRMMMQTSKKASSMKNLYSAMDELNRSDHSRTNRRGLMLRQGSFVAGSRILTLRA